MNVLKLMPSLLLLTAVMFSVPALKSLIAGDPLNVTFFVLSTSFFGLAIVFLMIRRKSSSGSSPPSA